MKFILNKIILITFISSITLLYCSDTGDLGSDGAEISDEPVVLTNAEIAEVIAELPNIETVPVEEGEIAVLETSLGTIKFKFFPEVAPNQSANFKKLANSGFFDWTLFHRVIPGFMIQGGDILSKNSNPGDDGTGDPGFTVDAEFSDITHARGIVSTARKGGLINSASSQFFIVHADSPFLDGQYTVFGEVIEGMEVVDLIASKPSVNDRPNQNIYLKRARVIKP